MDLVNRMRFALRSIGNVHRPSGLPDIFLFATARGGSTWLMEILASQPGMKYFDEPLSPRRDYARVTGITWEQLMPDAGDAERILSLFQSLQRNELGALNVTPFGRYYRFLTSRIVFKVHEIEHLMEVVAQKCNAQIVCLLRHPIATSISRSQLPRLELFLQSSYYTQMIGDDARVKEVRRIASLGTQFERAVISWCFENLDVTRARQFDGLVITYEELVLNPEQCSTVLLERFSFTDRAAMLRAFERPAKNIAMSHRQTIDVMQRAAAQTRRIGLVTKWQSRVTQEQQQQAATILDLFRIDAYSAWGPLAAEKYLVFAEETPKLLNLAGGDGQVAFDPHSA